MKAANDAQFDKTGIYIKLKVTPSEIVIGGFQPRKFGQRYVI